MAVLLKEDSGALLQESGGDILLDGTEDVDPIRRRHRLDTDARDFLSTRPRRVTDARVVFAQRPSGERGRKSTWWGE